MFIVITHVQRHAVDWPVITERLLIKIVRVMLLNPARSHRMQPNGKEKRERQIEKPGPATEINDGRVVDDRARQIQRKPAVPHPDRFQPRRTRYLEKWEEHQPD